MNRVLRDEIRLTRRGQAQFRAPKILAAALLSSTVLSGLPALGGLSATSAYSQELRQTDPNAQLLLKADQLIYDNDNEVVTASGNVQLDYDGYNVVADRVSYNQKTRRVKAFGNVEILEPDGNRIYAQEIDLTDDFSQGFVNALRVETPDNTRFAAESAERFADQKTVFNHGVYTACEPCKEKPDKAPIWQVKAQKVILDGVEKTVTYRNATFELFGLPIAYLPYFKHADSSVKRETGFLIPSIGYKEELGFWYRQPYFLVTGDSHDLTFAATGFSRQGVLGEVEWRHQLENGFYSVKAAGIRQLDKGAFATNTFDSTQTERGMIGTRGEFTINPRWTFGWNVLAQSDSNFSRTYKIKDFTASTMTNQVYLEGLHDKSFFNLSAKQYLIQNSDLINRGNAFQFESEQPTVRPVLDYNYVKSSDTLGGEFTFDVNVASIDRQRLSSTPLSATVTDARTYGINGDTTRVSADLGWKRSIIADSGFVVTPSLSLRGDWTSTNGVSDAGDLPVQTGSYTRFMPTAGLQVSYPILARTATSSHVFEPIAQIFARPDLGFDGIAANEDAQSLVFDATTLFQRDKFSGYDRIESGTRANIGIRYAGQFNNGLSLNGLIGQSFHLAGDNPYANQNDLANVGEESGLETSRSDYVASISATTNAGLLLNTRARFDERDFDIRRAETALAYANSKFAVSTNYTFIAAQPDYGNPDDRQQVGFNASYNINENWRVFGGAQYDMQTNVFVSDQIGLAYHDECFTFSLAFSETRARNGTTKASQSVWFKVGLRTIGDYEGSFGASDIDDLTGGSF